MPGTRYARSGPAAQGPCIYMVRYFREYYRRSSRELQRLESLSRSPVRRLLGPATLAPSCLLRPGCALPTPRPIQTHTILAHASQQAAAPGLHSNNGIFRALRCAAAPPPGRVGMRCNGDGVRSLRTSPRRSTDWQRSARSGARHRLPLLLLCSTGPVLPCCKEPTWRASPGANGRVALRRRRRCGW